MLALVAGLEAHEPSEVMSVVDLAQTAHPTRAKVGVMGHVHEWFGYAAADHSAEAAASASTSSCPFVPPSCTKIGGACSVHTGREVVTVCPKRFYYDDFRILREIASEAFAMLTPVRQGLDGLPSLVPGSNARGVAAQTGEFQIGVFGQGWGKSSGEVKLPPAMPDGARYSVDFVLVAVDPNGELAAFVPVEIQSIDTTNSYKSSLEALRSGRAVSESKFGMNWENVNKRILPQLIVKGLMLQGEARCTTGIYFVTPEPVFKRIMRRLGGVERFRQIPQQPATITFLRFEQAAGGYPQGVPVPLHRLAPVTISTSDLSLAFISPENLPAAGSYERRIIQKL